MRLYGCLGAALLLAACGTTAAALTPARVVHTGSAASCAGLSPAQEFALARRVFVGVMLPGPTVAFGSGRMLASPARMRVERYLKGHGPETVRIDTAVTITPDGFAGNSEGIEPRAGQRWKIYTTSRRQPFDTSICLGSRQVTGSPALALWRAFPVDANPRPIVPEGEGTVIDPRTGFRTGPQKLAYLEGRFVLHAPLPGLLVSFGTYQLVSSTVAYRRLRAAGRPGPEKVPPLVITGVHLGTAKFLTDRGPMALPAWKFVFKGVSDPASVLAVARSDLFLAPARHRFGPPGPGSFIGSATVSASGMRITISFIGAPAGTAPCDASYTATATADRRAVAVAITEHPAPAPPGQPCTAVGYSRTAVLHLARPLGARVLVSAADGGAIPVTPAR